MEIVISPPPLITITRAPMLYLTNIIFLHPTKKSRLEALFL